jgi:hypothetical protein
MKPLLGRRLPHMNAPYRVARLCLCAVSLLLACGCPASTGKPDTRLAAGGGEDRKTSAAPAPPLHPRTGGPTVSSAPAGGGVLSQRHRERGENR